MLRTQFVESVYRKFIPAFINVIRLCRLGLYDK